MAWSPTNLEDFPLPAGVKMPKVSAAPAEGAWSPTNLADFPLPAFSPSAAPTAQPTAAKPQPAAAAPSGDLLGTLFAGQFSDGTPADKGVGPAGKMPASIWQVPGAFNPEPASGPGLGAQIKAGIENATSQGNIFDLASRILGLSTKPASPTWNQYPDQAYYANIMNTPAKNLAQKLARGLGELIGQAPLYISMATGVGEPAAAGLGLEGGAAETGLIGSEQAARAADLSKLLAKSLGGGMGFAAAQGLQGAIQPGSTAGSALRNAAQGFTMGAWMDPAFSAAGEALGGLWSWLKGMQVPETPMEGAAPVTWQFQLALPAGENYVQPDFTGAESPPVEAAPAPPPAAPIPVETPTAADAAAKSSELDNLRQQYSIASSGRTKLPADELAALGTRVDETAKSLAAMTQAVRASELQSTLKDLRGLARQASATGMGADETTAITGRIKALTDQLQAIREGRPATVTAVKRTPTLAMTDRTAANVGTQKVKAFMWEHPQVKPYIQAEAKRLLGELGNTTKGEKWAYREGGSMDLQYQGVKRHTSDTLAGILDTTGATYAEVADALGRIIDDQGQENQALAKRIELAIDDNLSYGTTAMDGSQIPPNSLYLAVKAAIPGEAPPPPEPAKAAFDMPWWADENLHPEAPAVATGQASTDTILFGGIPLPRWLFDPSKADMGTFRDWLSRPAKKTAAETGTGEMKLPVQELKNRINRLTQPFRQNMVTHKNIVEDWEGKVNTVNLIGGQIYRSIKQAVGDDPARLTEAFMAAGNVRDVADPTLQKIGGEVAQVFEFIRNWANNNGLDIPFWGVTDWSEPDPVSAARVTQAVMEGKPDDVVQALARERYVPHYRKTDLAEKGTPSAARKNASAFTTHSMQRELTTQEALAKWGDDLVTDAAFTTAEYFRRVARAVVNKQMLDFYKQFVDPETGERIILPATGERVYDREAGQWTVLPGTKAPDGWRSIPDPPGLQHLNLVQHMRARPDVAQFLESVFHKTTLEQGDAYKAYLKAKGGITRFKMLNPIVHGMNVTRAMLAAGVNPYTAIRRGAEYWGDDNPKVQYWVQRGLNFESGDWETVKSLVDEATGKHQGVISKLSDRSQGLLWNGIVRNGMIGTAEKLLPRFMAAGLDEEAAARLTAAWTNKIFGMISTSTWSTAARIGADLLLFAPRWVSSRWDIALQAGAAAPLQALSGAIKRIAPGATERLAGVDKFLGDLGHMDRFSPAEQAVMRGQAQKFLATAITGSYAVMNALNLAMSGHLCVQNGKGHRFEVDLGYKVQMREQYLDLAGWIRDYVRMPGELGAYWFYKMHPIPAAVMEMFVGKERFTQPYHRYGASITTPTDKMGPQNILDMVKNLAMPGVMGVPESRQGWAGQLLGVPIRGGSWADPILSVEHQQTDATTKLQQAYIRAMESGDQAPFRALEQKELRAGLTTPAKIKSIMDSYRLRVIIEKAKGAGANPAVIRQLEIMDAEQRVKWLPARDRAKALQQYIQAIKQGAMD